jgi:D-glycero-D-manno-heptose 1,7-bisphosphate phosphatase
MGISKVISKRKAIFLDRDGVLNKAISKNGKPHPPASLAELIIIDGVADALSLLKKNNFLLIVVTNQPDVARGKTEKNVVEKINCALKQTLPIDDFFVCYHDDIDKCDCRKPLPGLILQAAKKYDIDLKTSFMVGDRWKDIAAGTKAGCKTIWIDADYNELKPQSPNFITCSLLLAANWILQQ